MIQFTVPGKPVAKGRPRLTTVNGHARAFTPAKTVAYEGLIAMAAEKAMDGAELLCGPVLLDVTATFAIPASWSKPKRVAAAAGTIKHVGRPDMDNLIKSCGDGLNGVVWRDDSQVAEVNARKVYGDKPGLSVQVTAL